MAEPFTLTPRLREVRDHLRFVGYLTKLKTPMGVLIERAPDDEWEVWPVSGWDDAHECETQARTVSTSEWAGQVWQR